MGDTLTTIIAIIVAVGVLIVFPLIVVSNSNDNVAQLTVETAVESFVDEACHTVGKITPENLDKFIQTLSGTGHMYEIDMEVQKLDQNPGKKSALTATDKIGENLYISYYNIEESVYNDNKDYYLEEGSRLYVSVKNADKTIFQMLVGSDAQRIVASYSAIVTTNAH